MTVTIEALEDHVEETVKIVGSTESDPFEGKISNESPVGRALMGAKAGDIVEAEAPSGVVKYKVIKIKAEIFADWLYAKRGFRMEEKLND